MPSDGSTTPHPPSSKNMKYDGIQHRIKELIDNPQKEKAKHKSKREEEQHLKSIAHIAQIKEKHPPNSIAWSIGDSPRLMMVLQIIVLFICLLSVCCTIIQMNITSDHSCVGTPSYGPYYGTKDSASYGCGWPQTNSIIRLMAPGVGFICASILLIITISSGRRLYESIKVYNRLYFPNEEDKGVQYYEIYNVWYFKCIRRIISACTYLQLVSFGLDLARYGIGKQYAEFQGISTSSSPDLTHDFEAPLFIGLAVAFVLRFTHDSIWISVKKQHYKCQIILQTDTTYATTTRQAYTTCAKPDKTDTAIACVDPNGTTLDDNDNDNEETSLSVTERNTDVPSTVTAHAPQSRQSEQDRHRYAPLAIHSQKSRHQRSKRRTWI